MLCIVGSSSIRCIRFLSILIYPAADMRRSSAKDGGKRRWWKWSFYNISDKRRAPFKREEEKKLERDMSRDTLCIKETLRRGNLRRSSKSFTFITNLIHLLPVALTTTTTTTPLLLPRRESNSSNSNAAQFVRKSNASVSFSFVYAGVAWRRWTGLWILSRTREIFPCISPIKF